MTAAARIARSIALAPVWFVQLFGTAKSFKDNPILGSRLLNRMGLHAARYTLAHAITNLRWLMLAGLVPRDQRRAFLEDGVIAIENFLPADRFSRLKAEMAALSGEARRLTQGDTITLMKLLDAQTLSTMPETAALLRDRRYRRLLSFAGARAKRAIACAHCIKNGYRDGAPDPQKSFHSDTFHPTMKSWLFLDDVTDENGPFNYVPRSQRFTLKRLKWEYRRSIAGRDNPDKYSVKGSFRAGPEDLEELGLPAPRAFRTPANTLVIANTHGFHRRGAAGARSSRMAVMAQSRTNPFNPLPGMGFWRWGDVENRIIHAYWRTMDRRAEKRNSRASWHAVSTEAFYE